MAYVLWQSSPGDTKDTAVHVRGAEELGLPTRLGIVASVSDQEDLRSNSRCYIQLSVPGVGPVLAWVGVPGGGQRDGHFIHPATGATWPWGQLVHAVQHAVEQAK
jgi:hypothetical protein